MILKGVYPVRIVLYSCVLLLLLTTISCNSSDKWKRSGETVLVLHFESSSDKAGKALKERAFDSYTPKEISLTQLTGLVQQDSLKYYSAIALLNSQFSKINPYQRSAIRRYVESGGGLLLIDPKPESPYYWPWLSKMINMSHEDGIIKTADKGGNVLIAFTEALEQDISSLKEDFETWLVYVIGENGYDASQVTSPMAPEGKRFVKKVLDSNVNEPVELAVLPDGRVLYIERDGKVKLYKPKEDTTKVIERFAVHMTGNYEDGMLGLALHPLFKQNGWVFIYYSPAGDEPKQNLSRFKMVGDSLLKSSEKIILEVPVQRETCCHSGGSIVFGPDRNLYLSTGDNTSSKESDGYTPLDERPGRSPFDAQKSSGNTNDLRGKIIRIKVNEDGSYEIPAGNLFAKDDPKARPEIYLMGVRNPFRFAVDPTNGFVYWGDVGPDAGKDGPQGPKSYDEFNQARKAGNFGWPYFVGNNISYPDFNFATGQIGEKFDPKKPINDSPNNTGHTVLPPAQEAMIWYPYDESEEFPVLGTGSRAAMGGPFFYSENYPEDSRTKFPEYYDGKWFIYDWARSWIKVVSFDENSDLLGIEDFLPEMEFNKPIDMEFGPDGSMYILEYGANYFTDNDDATLSKIEYGGKNMLPVPVITTNQSVGAAPLKVDFSAKNSYDYDGDTLSYTWVFEDEEMAGEKSHYTFAEPGIYNVKLIVTDAKGESAETETEIKAGNSVPKIDIFFGGNRTFFFEEDSIAYSVTIDDLEDGSSKKGDIPGNQALITFDYLPHGKDLGLIEPKNIGAVAQLKGKRLIENSDCKSCHALDKKSIGPTYLQVADRYKDDPDAIVYLGEKIIAGGKGNWGESMMAAHPQHTIEETREMVKYILSLGNDQSSGLPLKGSVNTDKHAADEETGAYIFLARYTDKGGKKVGPLTASASLILSHPKIQAEEYDAKRDVSKQRPQGGSLAFVQAEKDKAYIAFNDIDLRQISKIDFHVRSSSPGRIFVYTDNAFTNEVGSVDFASTSGWETNTMNVKEQDLQTDLYFVFEGGSGEGAMSLDWIQFRR